MEPRRELSESDLGEERPSPSDNPFEYFRKALAFARRNYSKEMDHIASTKFEDVTPEAFFLEYIWVVHATGFNAKVVGKMMPRLVEAYGTWKFFGSIDSREPSDRVSAVCNNPQKIRAVRKTAKLMCREMLQSGRSWESFKEARLSSPEKLQDLDYIGKITCFHLARNIGLLECVKPDLHLVRLAKHWRFANCEVMCEAMRPEGMPLGIVDLVLWYACSTFGTLDARQEGDR